MVHSTRGGVVRKLVAGALLAVFVVFHTGCYHTIVTTDLEPGTEIQEKWRPAFIAGLVPATLKLEDECGEKGIARAETQHSFLNWLVGFVTLGIFTPMDVRITCARG